jgi:hypothetical protein
VKGKERKKQLQPGTRKISPPQLLCNLELGNTDFSSSRADGNNRLVMTLWSALRVAGLAKSMRDDGWACLAFFRMHKRALRMGKRQFNGFSECYHSAIANK